MTNNTEEESYLDKILNYFSPSREESPIFMPSPYSEPMQTETNQPNKLLDIPLGNTPVQNQQKLDAPDFSPRGLAPFGTSINKQFSPAISTQDQPIQRIEPLSQTQINASTPFSSVFDSISNSFKGASKSTSDTFNDRSFREGLGGILVGLGAGIQGQDAGKALERYDNMLLSNKEEARRMALEEERKLKADPSSTWNLVYREMFKKYVPGVDKMLGDSYNSMTEEMLKSNYPMIASGIKNMTDKELGNPMSESSIDAVKGYNQMVSSFGGAVPLLEEGKYSANQVENFKSNINNVLKFIDNENEKAYKEKTLSQQAEQKSLDRMLERELQSKNLSLRERQFAHERNIDYAKLNLEKRKFEESKRRSEEAARIASQRLSQPGAGVFSDKERAKMAIDYPLGLALKQSETSKLTKMGTAYNKMEQSLDSLQDLIKKYGAPVNPSSDGYAQIESAWGSYMTALKDTEEMGALDGGVIKGAKSVLPKPTDFNILMRVKGEQNVVKSTLSVLSDVRNRYRDNFAKNTAMYGYNPNIGAGENIELMDKFIDPNTSDEIKKQIFSRYSRIGYNPTTFAAYADNYETRRKPMLGVR